MTTIGDGIEMYYVRDQDRALCPSQPDLLATEIPGTLVSAGVRLAPFSA